MSALEGVLRVEPPTLSTLGNTSVPGLPCQKKNEKKAPRMNSERKRHVDFKRI